MNTDNSVGRWTRTMGWGGSRERGGGWVEVGKEEENGDIHNSANIYFKHLNKKFIKNYKVITRGKIENGGGGRGRERKKVRKRPEERKKKHSTLFLKSICVCGMISPHSYTHKQETRFFILFCNQIFSLLLHHMDNFSCLFI